MKTNELTGAALDWAVAKCEGRQEPEVVDNFAVAWYTWSNTHYSTNWVQGGPIIDREGVCFEFDVESELFTAYFPTKQGSAEGVGETHLIAAMRCYVASKLGDEVDVPKELTP